MTKQQFYRCEIFLRWEDYPGLSAWVPTIIATVFIQREADKLNHSQLNWRKNRREAEIGGMCLQPRNTGPRQKLGKARNRSSPRAPIEGAAPLIPWLLPSNTGFRLLFSRTMANTFMVFKPLHLWEFITVAIRNQHSPEYKEIQKCPAQWLWHSTHSINASSLYAFLHPFLPSCAFYFLMLLFKNIQSLRHRERNTGCGSAVQLPPLLISWENLGQLCNLPQFSHLQNGTNAIYYAAFL